MQDAEEAHLVPASPDIVEGGEPQGKAEPPGNRTRQVVDGLHLTPVGKLGPATALTQT